MLTDKTKERIEPYKIRKYSFFIVKARIESHKSKKRFSLHKGNREPYRTKKNHIFMPKIANRTELILESVFGFFISRSANRTVWKIKIVFRFLVKPRIPPYEKLKAFFDFYLVFNINMVSFAVLIENEKRF